MSQPSPRGIEHLTKDEFCEYLNQRLARRLPELFITRFSAALGVSRDLPYRWLLGTASPPKSYRQATLLAVSFLLDNAQRLNLLRPAYIPQECDPV